MATKEKKSAAMRMLERISGPLTFAGFLQAIRLGEEETLAVFAARLGVTRAYLCDIEKGRRRVSIERAAEWAKALGYHPPQFVELALQAEIEAAGLRLRVTVRSAA